MAIDPILIKPRDLPAAADVYADDAMVTDNGLTVGRATPVQVVNAGAPVASQAEAIAGVDNAKRMTPLRTKQVLAPAILLAQAWAESPTPPDPDDPTSKSAKTWAGEAEADADRAEVAAAAMNLRGVTAAALPALSTSQYKGAFVTDKALAPYVWDSENRSAAIAAGDPRYVAPASDPTGASGAWALWDRVFANAEDLGVVTGTVSDAVALSNAQKINKWLSSSPGRVFDWRSDAIGIGETIRLGEHGNGVVGVPAGSVFGGGTGGAVARWQGEAGGTMFLARRNVTTEDLNSPSIVGVTANANSLAGCAFDISGVMKPFADKLHVYGLRDNSASYGFKFRHNPDATGGQVNCCYGGRFGSLTCVAPGSANGFLVTGRPSASGQGVTFCQFDYLHATCWNGYAFVFQKGDDNVFTQLGVSRAAGGTGGAMLINSQRTNQFNWVGNVYHNINLSKQDGAALQILVSDDGTMGNSITYNGVDFMPTVVLSGGSIRSHNKWTFLGQSNYLGGWTNRPHEDLFGPRFPNIDVAAQDVLDHYQERTADLPSITFGGASDGVAYGARNMRSVRIGGVVILSGSITLTNKGTSTGNATITGLPVAATAAGAINIGYYANLASAFASPPMGAAGSTSSIALFKAGAASAAAMTDADFTNTTRIDFSVAYVVA